MQGGRLLQRVDFWTESNVFMFLKPEEVENRPVFLQSLEQLKVVDVLMCVPKRNIL